MLDGAKIDKKTAAVEFAAAVFLFGKDMEDPAADQAISSVR